MFRSFRSKLTLASFLILSVFLAIAGSASMQDLEGALIPLLPVASSDSDEPGVPVNETSRNWFVEMASPPTADGTSLATTRKEKDNFRANARRAGLVYRERRAFDKLWNGVSVSIDPSRLSALSRIPGVRAVYPVETFRLPTVETGGGETPDMTTALAMTGADVAQNSLGLTGKGVKVGIIDTGVDYHHPDLGGCFGEGCRVSEGHDFVGDAYAGSASTPMPDNDPDDCDGHGTHVAGIVGANGGIMGAAPGITFGAYRVFGCDGSTETDIMIAAMERALADGMQVVNMSIGNSFQWPQYPTAQAADRLVNKGVVVIASIGNDGAAGLYAAGAPGVGKKVIGVANFENTHTKSPAITITPDDREISVNGANGGGAPVPTSGAFPMARTGTAATANDACDAVAPEVGSLTGTVALIRRGTCTFHEKVRNAQTAGAVGVVIYNNIAEPVTPNVGGAVPITIPVVSIAAADGEIIDARLAAGPVDMTWKLVANPNSTGGLIRFSSSYGMAADLSIKPDIGAPGGAIRSTYPLEISGGYANLSGTSMSSPHVAGAVALLLEARPNTPANAVRTILQNSADPKAWSGNPGFALFDMVHRQGAGMLDIDDAILSTTMVEPSNLALGESEFGPATRTLTIKNESATAETYDLSHIAAMATGPNTFIPEFFEGFANVSFTIAGLPASAVPVPAKGTATVDVTVAPNASLADRTLYGGYLVLTAQGSGAVTRVPYAGFKGDYQSIQVLTPTDYGYPWLAKRNSGDTFDEQPDGARYTMQDDDIPYFVVHLDHQSRRLRMEVLDTAGNSWHRAFQQEYLGRNSGAATFFSYSWDGKTTNGRKTFTVPDGRYVVRFTVEKALGDGGDPAHTETWTSPIITIDRP